MSIEVQIQVLEARIPEFNNKASDMSSSQEPMLPNVKEMPSLICARTVLKRFFLEEDEGERLFSMLADACYICFLGACHFPVLYPQCLVHDAR